MTAKRQREIVVEFEKVQMMRKRAKTLLMHCDSCNTVSDAVSQIEAAKLFETSLDKLNRFIEQHNCHYHVSYEGHKWLCITSLLDQMQREQNRLLLSLTFMTCFLLTAPGAVGM